MRDQLHTAVSRAVRAVAACVLAVTVWAPASAAGSVLGSDRVGGLAVAERPDTARAQAPDLRMKAGALYAMDGRELWSRDQDRRRQMASTTKIMTAVVVLERGSLDESVTVPPEALKVGESEAGLRAGQRWSVRELLEAMLVKSGNDAAYTLAEHVGGTERRFVGMMDDKAAELGLEDTDYANSHGLDAVGHHTSAADLATLSRYAMTLPEFRSIVSSRQVTVTSSAGSRRLENSNELLRTLPGAEGIKTGWTNGAGYCVVAAAERRDVELVAVVLGTSSEKARFREATELLEWGFAHYRVRELASRGATVGAAPVSDYLDVSVAAVVGETTAAPVFDLDGEVKSTLALDPEVRAPVTAGQRLGSLTVSQGERLLAQVPVVAAADVRAPTFWERIRIGAVRTWRAVFGGG